MSIEDVESKRIFAKASILLENEAVLYNFNFIQTEQNWDTNKSFDNILNKRNVYKNQ